MADNQLKQQYFHFAEQGQLAKLKALLAQHPALLSEKIVYGTGDDSYSSSALHLAALYGHQKVVDYLIQQGLSPEIRDSKGNTLVHAAAAGGHAELLKHLSTRYQLAVDTSNEATWTALHVAARYGHTSTVAQLLEQGAQHLEDNQQRTPYAIANHYRYPRTVEILKQHFGITSLLPRQQKTYRNLVLEGGGIKGIGHIGALMKLRESDERMNLAMLDRVLGTSAGAIAAAYLCCGVALEDIAEQAFTDLPGLKDGSSLWKGGIFSDIKRVFVDFGFYKGDALSKRIGDLLEMTLGNRHATFADLHRAVINQSPEAADKAQRFRDLYVVGANISTGFEEVFSYETTPQMPIMAAVRISGSIPIFYQAIRAKKDLDGQFILNEDGSLKTDFPDNEPGVHVYGDGGIFNNYFISYFDNAGPNPETIGIKLKTKEATEALLEERIPEGKNAKNIIQYLKQLISTMATQKNEFMHQEAHNARTIFVETEVSAIDFDISDKGVKSLIDAGKTAVDTFLARKEKYYPSNPLDYQDKQQQRLELQKILLESLYTTETKRHFDYKHHKGIIQLVLTADKPSERKLIEKLQKLMDSKHVLAYQLVKGEGNRVLQLELDEVLVSHFMDCCNDHGLSFSSTLIDMSAQEQLLTYQNTHQTPAEKGENLLQLIRTSDNIHTIEQALKEESPLNYHDAQGNTALHLAVKQNNHFLVNLLLRYGANYIIDLKNNQGQSALHIAAARDDVMVGILLLHQANQNSTDNEGKTPLKIARDHNVSRAVQIMQIKQTAEELPEVESAPAAAGFFSEKVATPKVKGIRDKMITEQRVRSVLQSDDYAEYPWELTVTEKLMIINVKDSDEYQSIALLKALESALNAKGITSTVVINESSLLINLIPIYTLQQDNQPGLGS